MTGLALAAELEAVLPTARAAVVAGLIAIDSELFGSRVWRDRSRAPTPKELPAIFVYTPGDRVQRIDADSARVYFITAELLVEVVTASTSGAVDVADRIARQAQEVLGLDETLGGCVDDVTYTGRRVEWTGEGDRMLVSCTLHFDLAYRLNLPSFRPLHDLETIALDVVAGPDGTPVEQQELQIDQT